MNSTNTSDATPLHTAAANGQAMSVEWLLAHGADATLKNDDGQTATALAKTKDRLDLARVIQAHLENPQPPPPPPAGSVPTSAQPAAPSSANPAVYEFREEVD